MRGPSIHLAVVLVLLFVVTGCGGLELIPTPNLYVGSDVNPFAGVPEALQSNQVDVLYVTDRKPEQDDEDDPLRYGYGRSLSMA